MTYKKEFIKLINSISGRYTPVQVFTDFVTISAMSIANSVDFKQAREDKYMDIIQKYEPKEQKVFPELFNLVVEGIEENFCDFLGNCFEEIGASNSKTGQFFTPYSVSKVCAETVFDKEKVDKVIAEKGYITINEPAAGGGSMIIAYLEVLKDKGYNFQTQSLTIAQDIDYRCAYMCYVMLSLLGVPAIVCIGDTLKMELWEELHTPFYVFNYWKFKNPIKKVVSETTKNAVTEDKELKQLQTIVKDPTMAEKQLSFF